MVGLMILPVGADEKPGMPDLAQIEETCLPTSTANLIIWFGKHGYPKLIVDGDGKEDGYIHTVHRIMGATDARFDWGTRMEKVTIGIDKYIKDAGYDCDVEYRGLDYGEKDGKKPLPFSQDWLKDNDDPNKGFILLLGYIHYSPGSNTFSPAIYAGHAVTLVNAESDMLLIHDPAHYEDETGRKIITPQTLTQGIYQETGMSASVSGLLLLSGSLLEAPPDSEVLLKGAVCVTMHPPGQPKTQPSPISNAPEGLVAAGKGDASSPSATPGAPGNTTTNWWEWFFDLFFKK